MKKLGFSSLMDARMAAVLLRKNLMPERAGDSSLAPAQKRRAPRQSRARVTLESILDATSELIEQYGYADVTTSRIAERVGVSVGTLYQYFPNKEAIAFSLVETHSMRFATELRQLVYKDAGEWADPVAGRKAVRVTIDRLLETFEKDKVVLIDLVDELPAFSEEFAQLLPENLIRNSARMFLEQRRPPESQEDLEVVTFIISNMIFDAIRKYVNEDPRPYPREEFVEQMARCTVATFSPATVFDRL